MLESGCSQMGLLVAMFYIAFTAEGVAAMFEGEERSGFRSSGGSFRHEGQDEPFMLREINQ